MTGLKWLGTSDELVDMGFSDFLVLIDNSLPDLIYTKVHYNYIRVRLRNQSPDDPEYREVPIMAREEGKMVSREQIQRMLQRFHQSIDIFKGAYNALYGLTQPTA